MLFVEDEILDENELGEILYVIEKNVVCSCVLVGELCIDGCEKDMICGLDVCIGVLLCIYGFVLFICGEMQVLVIVMLGIVCDVQVFDELMGECIDIFLFYYNFFLYFVGEIGMVGFLKCCEIGYGCLVKCGVLVVMLDMDKFLYIVCVVFEIIEFNGFFFMVFVCGVFLVLMDVGVLIKVVVVGIVMGLVKEGDNYVVLFDILGDEDYLGDMDFKVVGFCDGIFVLQMDIKIEGIIKEIMQVVLNQVKGVCLYILGVMEQVINVLCGDIFEFVLCIYIIKINLDKIKDVIGKGGFVICVLIEEVGIIIEIEDDGIVKIVVIDGEKVKYVICCIEEIIVEIEVGCVYIGKVICIVDFGVFVVIGGGKEGLVYIF